MFLCLSLFGTVFSCSRYDYAQVKVGGQGKIANNDTINRYTVIVKLFVSRRGRMRPGSCSGTSLLATHYVNNVWRAKVMVGVFHARGRRLFCGEQILPF